MVWQAALGIGSALLGGIFQNEAADAQRDAIREGNDAAINEQRRQFDAYREMTAPARYRGNAAGDLLGMNYGIAPYADRPQAPQPGNALAGVSSRPDYAGYVRNHEDLSRAFGSNAYDVRNKYPDEQSFGQFHYNTFGQNEGRELPMVGGNPTAGLGRDLTGTPAAATGGEEAGSLQDQFYDRFQESGEYRSMIPVTDAGMDRITGALGAGGSVLSGSAQKALTDYMKRNENAAFGQFTNALRATSGQGQTVSGQVGQAGMNMANNIGQLQQGTAAANAGRAGAGYSAWGDALGTIAGGTDWGSLFGGGGGGAGGVHHQGGNAGYGKYF